MCMEDVRIARMSTTRTRMVPVAMGTWVQVAVASPDRYSIVIVVSGQVPTLIVPGSLGTPANPAQLPGVAQAPLVLDLQHHGDMVRQPHFVWSDGGASTAYVTETNLEAQ